MLPVYYLSTECLQVLKVDMIIFERLTSKPTMKPQHLPLLFLLALSSCAHPLLNPLKDGTIDRRNNTWKQPSAPIHILPGESLEVHACENSKIQKIVTGPDSSIS